MWLQWEFAHSISFMHQVLHGVKQICEVFLTVSGLLLSLYSYVVSKIADAVFRTNMLQNCISLKSGKCPKDKR